MNGRSVSEHTRERETFKYDPSLLTDIVYNEDGRPLDNNLLRTSHDAVLTSIASLGASRIGTAASLISLFDQKWQYIVAEATPTLTLAPWAKADKRNGEQLWLCGTAIPRVEGVCEHTLVSQNPDDFEKVGDSAADLPLSLVEDLGQDVRHCSKPWCAPGSPARFYAAVPIRSKRGINIGVYCVIDTVPRKDWDDHKTQIMRELSHTIMDYLELRRSKDEYRRSARMTRGLGSFVDGRATTAALYEDVDYGAGGEGAVNTNQLTIERQQDAETESPAALTCQTPLESPPEKSLDRLTSPPATYQGPGTLDTPAPAIATMVYPQDTGRSRTVLTSSKSPNDDLQSPKEIFSKAANIIRESIEIEGALFLDATLKSFGGLAKPLGTDSLTTTSQSESEDIKPSESKTESQSPCCDVLGYSTSQSSSIDGDQDVPRHTTVPEKLLSALLRRYPKGRIFTFDEHGALESSDSSDTDHDSGASSLPAPDPKKYRARAAGNPWERHLEGASISQVFPGARSVAFVPIWDAKKDRWCAGCFAFTCAPTRIFTAPGELSYLRAFGMLIMSETYRLEATMANKAKSDVLSSLSHELRSPLHGVVLGVELLHDTKLDIFQGDVLHTVETCGRTLLDTVDHLLDFAKINNYKRSERQRKQAIRGLSRMDRTNTSIEDGMKTLTVDVRLDVLAEEVLESVAAGSTFQRMSIAQLARRDKRHVDRTSNQRLDSIQAVEELGAESLHLQSQPRKVSIFLDIDPNFPWIFSVAPGSIRRILMNLFGNSLKYTHEGTIKVSLTQETPARKGRAKKSIVKLTVADTGKGISEEFLRNDLFKPFSQEDRLAPGTGLGLSLVKQIVSTLGGTISLQSGVNIGTKISVLLPLIPVATPSPFTPAIVTEEDREFDRHVQKLKGLRIKLLGFNRHVVNDSEEFTSKHIDEHALKEGICRDWLGMVVLPGGENDTNAPSPDLILCTEASLDTFEPSRPPTVVMCDNSLVAYHMATSVVNHGMRGVVEYISQPTGPRKLAKTLYRAYKRWSDTVRSLAPVTVKTTSPRERHTSVSLPTRPKLLRSHTTSESRRPSALLSPKRSNLETNAPSQLSDIGAPLVLPDHPVAAIQETNDVSSSENASQIAVPIACSMGEAISETQGETVAPPPMASGLEGPLEFLLVDDNPINLKILSSYMKKLGYKYITASNGQEAVDMFLSSPSGRYSCVFMDISMPIMDGFEATRRIRAFERESRALKPASIFALSGLGSAEAQREAFASGIDLFLAKPVKLKELSSILETRGLL
ncbi:hypothetical protein N0V93_009824 [Gnomoniopsis smithogilvyi]|uniref:Uncharacterized protein n=1 Tax=Gnomoniopsis smithogilvyi TaxID=1191159 RepID=A0A9W8YJZ7_9PEZI|nr:hypothetical protein N0V93_009824 [Gnomoniopsis smithogilvyi]